MSIPNAAPVIAEGASVAVSLSNNSLPTSFNLTLHSTDTNNDILTWSIPSAASHGTASASGTGSSKAIAYIPTTGYTGPDSFVVGVADGNGGTATIMVNVTVTATPTYTVSTSVTGTGSITPSALQTINSGASTSFTVTSGANYHTASVTGCSGILVGTTYTTGQIVSNCTVTANFVPDSVNGACGISHGSAFTIAPTISLCASPSPASTVTGTGPWSWTCPGTNGGTTATCNASIQTRTITASVTGSNGSVSCTSPVNNGAASTCTVTPASGYQLATFTDNTIDKKGSVVGNSYSIVNVTANHAIAATFTLIPVTPINGTCGAANNATFTTTPTINLCATNSIASNVTGSGPWNWSCAGSNGGTTASCSATRQILTRQGDCDNSGTVTIAEVQSAINMFLGLKAVAGCVDISGDSSVSIAEVQKVINSFLGL
jgi:hypothetical protein